MSWVFLRSPVGHHFVTSDNPIHWNDPQAPPPRPCREAEATRGRYLAAIVTVALNTGMRKGEILGLTWDRVDFSRGVVLLERTKSGRRREVPMNAATDAALARLPRPGDGGLVFRKADGAAWGSIRTAFERAVRAAGLEDFRFHDLRHNAESRIMPSSWPDAGSRAGSRHRASA